MEDWAYCVLVWWGFFVAWQCFFLNSESTSLHGDLLSVCSVLFLFIFIPNVKENPLLRLKNDWPLAEAVGKQALTLPLHY